MITCLNIEKATVKPNMSVEDEWKCATTDIIYDLSALLLLVSGYYRATAYAKGWEYYSHEPIFWVKMAMMGVYGACSLFPTITFIQRSIKLYTGRELQPMSEKLAKRLQQLFNAQLVAVFTIPS